MSKRKQTIWWNEEVKDAVKVKNRLFRIWMKERTPETRASYIAARNDSERIKKAIQENILEQSVSRPRSRCQRYEKIDIQHS